MTYCRLWQLISHYADVTELTHVQAKVKVVQKQKTGAATPFARPLLTALNYSYYIATTAHCKGMNNFKLLACMHLINLTHSDIFTSVSDLCEGDESKVTK